MDRRLRARSLPTLNTDTEPVPKAHRDRAGVGLGNVQVRAGWGQASRRLHGEAPAGSGTSGPLDPYRARPPFWRRQVLPLAAGTHRPVGDRFRGTGQVGADPCVCGLQANPVETKELTGNVLCPVVPGSTFRTGGLIPGPLTGHPLALNSGKENNQPGSLANARTGMQSCWLCNSQLINS